MFIASLVLIVSKFEKVAWLGSSHLSRQIWGGGGQDDGQFGYGRGSWEDGRVPGPRRREGQTDCPVLSETCGNSPWKGVVLTPLSPPACASAGAWVPAGPCCSLRRVGVPMTPALRLAPQVCPLLLVARGLHLQQRTVRLMIFPAALLIVSPFLLALKVTDLQSTLFRVITECELGSLWPHVARCQVRQGCGHRSLCEK